MCYLLTFWPGQKCHSRWCTGRKWHILMAVMRGYRVGGNWVMKWDDIKKIPLYSHRLTHRKRVTTELHYSYFHSMTITQAIPKIAEVTHPDRQISEEIAETWRRVQLERDVVGKPGRRGSREPWLNWGPEENEKDITLPTITLGANILVMFGLQLPLTCKPWVTLFEPLQ